MNAVVEALGEPFYAHCVKAVMDGKDFYDNYNNEPIFYMDDVGQKDILNRLRLTLLIPLKKNPKQISQIKRKV